MKGYIILLLITAILLCVLPVCFVKRSVSPSVSEEGTTDFLLIDQDGGEQAMDEADFARYATLNVLSPDSPDEAIKAVASAMYTLGMYQTTHEARVHPIGEYPSSYTEEHWKATWGDNTYETQMPRIKALVSEVTAVPVCYHGEPIMAAVHAMNNGRTESAKNVWGEALPYLVSVDSAADANAPEKLSTHTFSQADVTAWLQSVGVDPLPDASEWFRNAETTAIGTVKSIGIGKTRVEGVTIQEAFSLPSAVFSVSVQEEQVIFTVQGNGHFVGMSLCGCVEMANEGASWKEILSHYYSGINI